MVLLPLLVALVGAQHSLTVDIGGRPVPVTFPDLDRGAVEKRPVVELGGFKYFVGPNGSLGERFTGQGGWREVAGLYPAIAQRAATAPEYRIKVFLFSTCEILDQQGTNFHRRTGFLTKGDIDEIYQGLARFKAIAETAAKGGVRVTFDVTEDQDLLFWHMDGPEQAPRDSLSTTVLPDSKRDDGRMFGPRFIAEEIGPVVNNSRFDSVDGRYRGPYGSVFVVHAMPTLDFGTYLLDRTPVTTIGWSSLWNQNGGDALSARLFEAWLDHIVLSAKASGHQVSASLTSGTLTGQNVYPRVSDFAITEGLLRAGNHFSTAFSETGDVVGSDRPIIEVSPTFSLASRAVQIGAGQFAVDPLLVDLFIQRHPEAKPVGRLPVFGSGWDRTVLELSGLEAPKDLDVFGLTAPPPAGGGAAADLAIDGGPVTLNPESRGDSIVTQAEDPVVGPSAELTLRGPRLRGSAVLAVGRRSAPLTAVKDTTWFSVWTKGEMKVPVSLRFDVQGTLPIYANLSPGLARPAELSGPGQPVVLQSLVGEKGASGWTERLVYLGGLPAGSAVNGVTIGPSPYWPFSGLLADEDVRFSVAQIRFKDLPPPSGPVTATDPFRSWLDGLKAPLSSSDTVRLRAVMAGRDAEQRLNAIGALVRIAPTEFTTDLGVAALSADAGEAYLAIQALKKINEDRSWSQVASVALRGPFGHNYRFAAEALASKPEEVTVDLLSAAMFDRSRHARLAAARTLASIDTDRARLLLSTMLDDPDARVRETVAQGGGKTSDLFAKRLLWSAVNDESEWVRIACCLRLMKSENPEMRTQASNGVRDEGESVKLAVLRAIAALRSDEYRAALRIAVVDRSAAVRAAALRAFSTQPGPVVLGEVQNTVTDKSPLVRAALKELAAAKGIALP